MSLIDGKLPQLNDSDIRLLKGRTPTFASTYDQRFSFSLHIPFTHDFNGPELPLLVVVHGVGRRIDGYLEWLKDFSDTERCVVMCPLFPAGIIDPEDIGNYTTVLYKDIRFDLILLFMIEQASRLWRIRSDKFFLHGFSGGGQFAHRFFYLHPDRLLAVSVAAPGSITTPNADHPWPSGLLDAIHRFGLPNLPNLKAMASIPVQLIVGGEDLKAIVEAKTSTDKRGETRVDKAHKLKAALDEVGVRSELLVIPGVGHDGQQLLPALKTWLVPLVRHLYTN